MSFAVPGIEPPAPITAPPSGQAESSNLPPWGNPDDLSIADYCARLPKRRHAADARGKLLFLPRTRWVVLPVETSGRLGWECLVVLGDDTYRPDGFALFIGNAEIETAVQVPTDRLPALAVQG